MRTVTFKSVIDKVATKVLGTADNLTRQKRAALVDSIAEHLRECWERVFWPELLLTEERAFRDTWTTTTYASGSEVYYSPGDAYYVANASASGADVPGTSSKWDKLTGTDLRRYVSLDQTGKTAIGTVEQVTNADPRSTPGTLPLRWSAGPDGIELSPYAGADTTVWVRFRRRVPQFTSTDWAAGSYASGSVVYYATTGECYVASSAASSGDVPGTAALWVKQSFPYIFQRTVALFAAADHRMESGQLETRNAYLIQAEDALADEYRKAFGQQAQIESFRVLTRAA